MSHAQSVHSRSQRRASRLVGAVIAAMLLGSTSTAMAQGQQPSAAGNQADLVGWYEVLQAGGDAAQQARKNLVKHSAESAVFLLEKLKQPGADRSSLVYLMSYLSEAAIPALCDEARAVASPIRVEALELLSKFTRSYGGPAPQLVAVVMAAVASEEASILEQAFGMLGEMRAVAELHLADASPIGPRCAVAMAGAPRPPLAALLAAADDRSAFVRRSAAAAIASSQGIGATRTLCRLVLDEDATVRIAAWQAVAMRYAQDAPGNGDLEPLLAQRLTARIGRHAAATYDELRERAKLVESMALAGVAAIPLLVAVLELPVSPDYWVAVETDKVRLPAYLALQALRADAVAALPALKSALLRDDLPLHLRALTLRILRELNLPSDEETAICWRAYQLARAAQPIEGLGEGYQRDFRAKRVELVQAAIAGLTATQDEDIYAELRRAAGDEIAPAVALAAMVRIAWQRPEVQQQALAALANLGRDAAAGEDALVLALSQRVRSTTTKAAVVREVLSTLVTYAGHVRPATSPNHYLHKPCLQALADLAPHLDVAAKSWLLDQLIAKGNGKGTPDEAISRLCVTIDAKLAMQRRDRGMVGRRIVGDILHAAPELLVADLDSPDKNVRASAANNLKSYGAANAATHAEFLRLLAKPNLQEPATAMRALTGLRPTQEFVAPLRAWLDREPLAYGALAAIRPAPVAEVLELLAMSVSEEDLAAIDWTGYRRMRHVFRGLRELGVDGSAYVPPLLQFGERSPVLMHEVAKALPYLGLAGVRAFLDLDPASRPPVALALERQMQEPVDVATRIGILALLLQRGEAIEGLDRVARRASFAQDPRIRTAAQLLLANLAPDSDEATRTMLLALDGQSEALRYQAVKALAKKSHEPRVRSYLHWLQWDDDERIAKLAKDAMQ